MFVVMKLPTLKLAFILWRRYTCSIMQPEKIGIYEIKSELGRGGMATVYLAYDPRFEREVAVKVLPRELLHADPQFRLRFEREAKIIAQLEHSAIVPVYDVGEADGQPYFVMRYMNGGSLSERIKSGIMTVEEALRILSIIAPGLDEAHSKGIIHRDIKPSNILFDRRNNPYISDFGIAKLSQAQAGNVTGSAIIGTPAYMAPEQAQGDSIDGRADIYSIGIILYEMLTGRQPYEADTPMAVAIKHITDPVPRILLANPKLPEGLDTIIQKAMAKNKNDRFTTTTDLTNALRDIRSNPTVIPTKVSTPEKGTVVSKKPVAEPAVPAPKKAFSPLAVILPILFIGLIAGGFAVFNMLNGAKPTPTTVSTFTAAPAFTETTAPTEAATEAVVPVATVTETVVPVTDTPAAAGLPVLGGADKIAFVANKEVWLMNVDGSDLQQVTSDGGVKNDLQWLPDGKTIIFLSGLTVKYYNIETDVIDTLTSFPSAASFNAFRVSHDGTQVMIAMNNEIFVVPFDLETMKGVSKKSDLLALNGCIIPKGRTHSALPVKEVRWSADDKLVSWLYKGPTASDLVSVLNIQSCNPDTIDILDSFPANRFDPPGFVGGLMPDFDWDGANQFIFNTSRRNNGWGELHIYNWESHRPTLLVNPIDKKCCYRDARWSPDGSYLLFAFQDSGLAQNAVNQLYYVPAGELTTGAVFQPIRLPDGFFKDLREAPQPALRPAR